MRAYRERIWTGKRGRPPWVGPETVTLTQSVKPRDEHGRLLSGEIRAALGLSGGPAGTVHVERPGGALRDRLNALLARPLRLPNGTRAFDALMGLQLFDHNFQRAHRCLRLPLGEGVHRYPHRSPAMALGVTDYLWSLQDLLTSRIPITP